MALERLCDFDKVAKSSALKGILDSFDSCSFDAIQLKCCFEDEIVASLKQNGVFDLHRV